MKIRNCGKIINMCLVWSRGIKPLMNKRIHSTRIKTLIMTKKSFLLLRILNLPFNIDRINIKIDRINTEARTVLFSIKPWNKKLNDLKNCCVRIDIFSMSSLPSLMETPFIPLSLLMNKINGRTKIKAKSPYSKSL